MYLAIVLSVGIIAFTVIVLRHYDYIEIDKLKVINNETLEIILENRKNPLKQIFKPFKNKDKKKKAEKKKD